MTVESPPEVLPAVGWRFPPVRESHLGNGLRLLAYHCPGQYVVSIAMVFELPLNAEPADREGVAGLVARCLVRGAGGLSADDFSDALAACGAELEAAASPDGFAVRLSVPRSHLARGLDLMAMALAEPAYALKEFEQERRLRLQEIEHLLAYPGSVTVEALNSALCSVTRGRPVRSADRRRASRRSRWATWWRSPRRTCIRRSQRSSSPVTSRRWTRLSWPSGRSVAGPTSLV